MAALAVTTVLLLASACFIESASVLNLRKHPEGGLGIYGGHPVNTTVPYYAMLIESALRYYLPCGGVVVHKQHILTSGACATRMIKNNVYNYWVGLGTNDYMVPGHLHEIEKIFIHPNFTYKYFPDKILWDYDVAVLKLRYPVTFDDRVQPIKMADPGLVLKLGDQVVSYGMGETFENIIPLHLQSLTVPYFDHKKCAEVYYQATGLIVTERVFCAGGERGKATVLGDYGGPVVYNNDTLVGLSSFCLFPFARDGVPSGYVNISVVRPFIDGVLKMDE